MRGRESACDRLVRLRRFRVTTLRHTECRRVVGWSRMSGITLLWGGGSSGRASCCCGGRPRSAGGKRVGGAGACARCGDGVGSRRLGGSGDFGRRGERNRRLGLVGLHQCRGGQGLGV